MLEVCILTVGHSPESFRGRASPPRRTALPPTRAAPAGACSLWFFFAEFLETRISAERVPERIELEICNR